MQSMKLKEDVAPSLCMIVFDPEDNDVEEDQKQNKKRKHSVAIKNQTPSETLYQRLHPILSEISKHVHNHDVEWIDHCKEVTNDLLKKTYEREGVNMNLQNPMSEEKKNK